MVHVHVCYFVLSNAVCLHRLVQTNRLNKYLLEFAVLSDIVLSSNKLKDCDYLCIILIYLKLKQH